MALKNLQLLIVCKLGLALEVVTLRLEGEYRQDICEINKGKVRGSTRAVVYFIWLDTNEYDVSFF